MKLNIYFIHATGLKDRERVIQELQKQLKKYQFKNYDSITFKTISDYEPNEISSDIIQRTVNYSPIPATDDIKEENKAASPLFYNQFIKNMHLFQLSNALKHYKALEYIANSEDDVVSIVLEDDVVYEDKVCLLLEKVLLSLPIDYDMVFLGLPGNTAVTNRNEIKYQPTSEVFRVLPYTDSYIISKGTAKRMYDAYLPIKFLGNIQFSYLIETLKLKTVITLPNIFLDGSKFGLFLSTLTPNNILVFNGDYMYLKNAVTKEEPITDEEHKKIDEIIEKTPIQNNPDFMYVKAQYLTKQKKYKEAESIYEKAYTVYTGNNCIVNHESAFLKDYIRLYKYIQ